MSIQLSSFHACCGIKILWNFKNEGGIANSEIEIEEVEKELKLVLKKGTKSPYAEGNVRTPLPKSAMLLIAVNTKQNELMKKMLLENGFKLVSKGWNGPHKNINYLYSLERKKPIKKVINRN